MSLMSLPEDLEIHPLLRERITQTYVYKDEPNSSTDGPSKEKSTSQDSFSSCASSSSSSSLSSHCDPSSAPKKHSSSPFVLYLPTVVLRKPHNPAFSLASHLANYYHLPLLVLAVVLDDSSLPASSTTFHKPITMTSRRLTFILQALTSATDQWSKHGAAVYIRVHGPNSRTPDHLTLCNKAQCVITDEPFVHPYLSYVQTIERACYQAHVPCYRVDGSTTVPPASVLKPKQQCIYNHKVKRDGKKSEICNGSYCCHYHCYYDGGVPAKAWMWQKQTEKRRMVHIQAALTNRVLDAPELTVKIENDQEELLLELAAQRQEQQQRQQQHQVIKDTEMKKINDNEDINSNNDNNDKSSNPDITEQSKKKMLLHLSKILPITWHNHNAPCPGKRPWTSKQLSALLPTIPSWSLNWTGADPTVPPCIQTIGTFTHGMDRWKTFREHKLDWYAGNRNDIRQPHSVSRMSCYINLGVVSIFDIVHDVLMAATRTKKTNTKTKWSWNGADKFYDEIVKWREISYAHAFAHPNEYNSTKAVPAWAVRYLEMSAKNFSGKNVNDKIQEKEEENTRYTLEAMELGQTGDRTWDAMQRYLVNTGELHNNARMTWGKTIVHWGITTRRRSYFHHPEGNATANTEDGVVVTAGILRDLCYLNDRYALDGLSPQSYAGLLWCLGWCDKPSGANGALREKLACRYRVGPEGFEAAERTLLSAVPGDSSDGGEKHGRESGRQVSILTMMEMQRGKRQKRDYNGEGPNYGGNKARSLKEEKTETDRSKNAKKSQTVRKGILDSFFMTSPENETERNRENGRTEQKLT